MVKIVATGHLQNTGNKSSDPDSRLTATRASGTTARRRRPEMRAGSGWPHVGHLLVAVIRVSSLHFNIDRVSANPLPPVGQDCAHAAGLRKESAIQQEAPIAPRRSPYCRRNQKGDCAVSCRYWGSGHDIWISGYFVSFRVFSRRRSSSRSLAEVVRVRSWCASMRVAIQVSIIISRGYVSRYDARLSLTLAYLRDDLTRSAKQVREHPLQGTVKLVSEDLNHS